MKYFVFTVGEGKSTLKGNISLFYPCLTIVIGNYLRYYPLLVIEERKSIHCLFLRCWIIWPLGILDINVFINLQQLWHSSNLDSFSVLTVLQAVNLLLCYIPRLHYINSGMFLGYPGVHVSALWETLLYMRSSKLFSLKHC